MKKIKIAIAQINPWVGDFSKNLEMILENIETARVQKADAVVFPEMAVTGYPPEDLLFRPAFLKQVKSMLKQIRNVSIGITVIVGAPVERSNHLYNMAMVYRDGKTLAKYAKQYLPNYRVFDEKRYFARGKKSAVIEIAGVPTGILICEDIWRKDPIKKTKSAGAELCIVLNASPFRENKAEERLELLSKRAKKYQMPIVYCNLVGGQDELVFDGHSLVVDKKGQLIEQLPAFESVCQICQVGASREVKTLQLAVPDAQIYQALVIGVQDYVKKNGFSGVLLGLSGGIDSALTLAVAVDALGADKVEAIMMPFRYTAEISKTDARQQAETQGVKYREIPIEDIFNSFMGALANEFAGLGRDVTEENIQSRSRGVLLMAMSNKLGKMLLATGNKSEMSMGYATLYGDMAGGFAPLKDVYKLRVFSLARYRNSMGDGEIIPNRVITRPPSAELAPDQKDEDSLPPYDILDPILQMFIEEFMSVEDIVALGYEQATVHRVANLLLLNEYKRRQAAPGVRISKRAFGKDRRYPITSAYRHHLLPKS
ncbi:MAG: NAD synthetase (EC / Glutamine amidotransferase chain of NAD synthetase [uncultured Thiotrichaceae bacterium]|uniref:Glutamine-dependent NAD(+) synthetase n=1 Tax=uncultured Thiotrichaceae bacterium TaxID=298394 RepID=A0A6S6TWB1_9GAMM|nr:MAG: NAD synthetase (EC / Glutamine amidotransferase chain of NAD synthetase [uncultured Thiotrichaceae bacterium]